MMKSLLIYSMTFYALLANKIMHIVTSHVAHVTCQVPHQLTMSRD